MGNTGNQTLTDRDILIEAQKMYDVYHLVLLHSSGAKNSSLYWKKLLGENCIEIKDYAEVSKIITDIVVKNTTGEIAKEVVMDDIKSENTNPGISDIPSML